MSDSLVKTTTSLSSSTFGISSVVRKSRPSREREMRMALILRQRLKTTRTRRMSASGRVVMQPLLPSTTRKKSSSQRSPRLCLEFDWTSRQTKPRETKQLWHTRLSCWRGWIYPPKAQAWYCEVRCWFAMWHSRSGLLCGSPWITGSELLDSTDLFCINADDNTLPTERSQKYLPPTSRTLQP